jgi:hypothetical protein
LGGLQFKKSLKKIGHKNQWLGTIAHTCHPSYKGKHEWRITVQASLGIKGDLISKITSTRTVE